MANSVDPDKTAPIGAVCSGSMQFASILNSSFLFGNYLQQTTSADNIFKMLFFLGALRVNPYPAIIFGYKNVVCLLHLLHIFKCIHENFYFGSRHYET